MNNVSDPDFVVMWWDQALSSEKAMMKPNETNPIDLPIPALASKAGNGADSQVYFYLINFLLDCLDRITNDRSPAANIRYTSLEEWSDEEYLYLEAHLPDDSSGVELDLNVIRGLICARIGRRTDGRPNIEPPAD